MFLSLLISGVGHKYLVPIRIGPEMFDHYITRLKISETSKTSGQASYSWVLSDDKNFFFPPMHGFI